MIDVGDAVGSTAPTSAGGDGFGSRLERLMRAAEEEAAEVRRAADRPPRRCSPRPTSRSTAMSAQREQWDERFATMTAAEERAGEERAAAQQKAASLLADAVAQAEDEAPRGRVVQGPASWWRPADSWRRWSRRQSRTSLVEWR